jgi:hypothetical protein
VIHARFRTRLSFSTWSGALFTVRMFDHHNPKDTKSGGRKQG